MKLEIRQDGILKYTIESTDSISEKEFVSVVRNASMSSIKFIEMYYDYYTECNDHQQAYERMERLHENLLGRRKFADYDSFKASKSRIMKK